MKHGRIAMDNKDVAALRRMTDGANSYVEIGTLWGGSAIEVARANPLIHIWCIDPFNGYYDGKDDWTNGEQFASIKLVTENMEEAGVLDRVILVQANSYPFPLPDLTFDTGLVDGCHTPECVRQDIDSLKVRCGKIAVHDIDDHAVNEVVNEYLVGDPAWRKTDATRRIAVFEKVI